MTVVHGVKNFVKLFKIQSSKYHVNVTVKIYWKCLLHNCHHFIKTSKINKPSWPPFYRVNCEIIGFIEFEFYGKKKRKEKWAYFLECILCQFHKHKLSRKTTHCVPISSRVIKGLNFKSIMSRDFTSRNRASEARSIWITNTNR